MPHASFAQLRTLIGKCIAPIAMRARMFAGRYLWWTMIAMAIFLFCAVYFDYVAWAIVQSSGCGRNASSCDMLSGFLTGTIKPAGFWLAGGIMLVCTLARIAYLKLGSLWGLAVSVWFLAAAPFPMLFINIWNGHLQLEAILADVPVPMVFLTLFTAYLLLPFDENERPVLGPWRFPRYAASLAAGHSVFLTLAENAQLPAFLLKQTSLSHLGAMVAHLQPQVGYVLELGTGSMVPAYVALWVFALSLLASLAPEEKVEAGLHCLHQLIQPEPRARRSRRA
jgi:hypothetical protein